MVFLVRSTLIVQGRPGAFLVGDIVTGDAIRAGMVARIPHGPDVFHEVQILGVEFVDHVGEKTSELALHVVGDTTEQAAAIDALEGAHLIEVNRAACLTRSEWEGSCVSPRASGTRTELGARPGARTRTPLEPRPR